MRGSRRCPRCEPNLEKLLCTRPCDLGQPVPTFVGDEAEQFFDAIAPYRRDDPKLGKMSLDRIVHGGLLADGKMAYAVKRQATLL